MNYIENLSIGLKTARHVEESEKLSLDPSTDAINTKMYCLTHPSSQLSWEYDPEVFM